MDQKPPITEDGIREIINEIIDQIIDSSKLKNYPDDHIKELSVKKIKNLPINLGECLFNNRCSSIYKNGNVIIKTNFKQVLKPPESKIKIARNKLLNEIQHLKLLNHINIIEMHHYFTVDNHTFIILEYANGLDLYEHMKIGNVMYEPDIQNILNQHWRINQILKN